MQLPRLWCLQSRPTSKTRNKRSKINQPCKDRGDRSNWSLESRAVHQPLGRPNGESAGRAPSTGQEELLAAQDSQATAEPQGYTWPQVRQLACQPWEQNRLQTKTQNAHAECWWSLACQVVCDHPPWLGVLIQPGGQTPVG